MHPDRRRAGRAIRKQRREAHEEAFEYLMSGQLGADMEALAASMARGFDALSDAIARMTDQFAVFITSLTETQEDYALCPPPIEWQEISPTTLSKLATGRSFPSPSSGTDSAYLSALWREDSPGSSDTGTTAGTPSATETSPTSSEEGRSDGVSA